MFLLCSEQYAHYFSIYQASFKKYTEDLVRWFKGVTKFVGHPVLKRRQSDFELSHLD